VARRQRYGRDDLAERGGGGGRFNWGRTHSERQIGGDGDLGAEVDAAVGVADGQQGVARRQGLHPQAAAVARAWRQPPCRSNQTEEGTHGGASGQAR